MSEASLAIPDQISALAERGIHHGVLKPSLCPCPAHDEEGKDVEDEEGRSIPIGALCTRTSEQTYEKGCQASAERHALTGVHSMVWDNRNMPRDRSMRSLSGKRSNGYPAFPQGLDPKTECAHSGETVLQVTHMTDDDALWENGRESSRFRSGRRPECPHLNDRLPARGSSFFISHANGETSFYKDTKENAESMLRKLEESNIGTTKKDDHPWKDLPTDTNGSRIVFNLDWNPIYKSDLNLPDNMDQTTSQSFVLRAAWDVLSRKWGSSTGAVATGVYEQDEADLKNIADWYTEDREEMIKTIEGLIRGLVVGGEYQTASVQEKYTGFVKEKALPKWLI